AVKVIGLAYAVCGQHAAAVTVSARVRHQDGVAVVQKQPGKAGHAFTIVGDAVQQDYRVAIKIPRTNVPGFERNSVGGLDAHVLEPGLIALEDFGLDHRAIPQRQAAQPKAAFAHDYPGSDGQNQIDTDRGEGALHPSAHGIRYDAWRGKFHIKETRVEAGILTGLRSVRGDQTLAHKRHNFRRDIRRRLDHEPGLAGNAVEGNAAPFRRDVGLVLVDNDRVGTVQKIVGGDFEIFLRGVEHGEINVGLEKAHNAVGLHDHVLGTGYLALDVGDGFAQSSLPGAHPNRAPGSGHQEARGIGLTGCLLFVAESAKMIVAGIAVTWFAVRRADAVT